jgi:predicted Fe-Mo cluster-binding NifX family protein
MKIAVPVVDDTLKMAGNAGHTPYFAVFTLKGGMFRSFEFEGLRANPKVAGEDPHEHDHDEHHTCDHDENDLEHIRAHDTMAEAIEDCDYLVVKMACKNTAKSMNNVGVKLQKYNGTEALAPKILTELAAQFK